jgi:streptomycin 6-kinase
VEAAVSEVPDTLAGTDALAVIRRGDIPRVLDNLGMQLPSAFEAIIRLREGEAGDEWLRSLPTVVGSAMERWTCTPDGPLRHGQVALVVPVASPHGAAAIKVSFPHEGNRHEAAALRLLNGRGAVRLLADAPESLAILLERADGPRPETTLSAEESVDMMGDLAHQLAVPAGTELRPLAETASAWLTQVDVQLHRVPDALPRSVVDRAREGIQLAADDQTTTVLHGDLHEANVLGAHRQSWLAIDLKGWSGTAAFDAWTVALTRPAEIAHAADPSSVVRGRVQRFAAAAGVHPDVATELAHARAVSSFLYETLHGADALILDLLTRILSESA